MPNPSKTATSDVDGDGACWFWGRSEVPTNAATPPSSDYRLHCDGGWPKYGIKINSAGPDISLSQFRPQFYSMAHQPLPLDNSMSLVADVAGTTIANAAYWGETCKVIPSSTLFIVLDMGSARDFFKPIEGASYCDMLQSSTKHRWSADGIV